MVDAGGLLQGERGLVLLVVHFHSEKQEWFIMLYPKPIYLSYWHLGALGHLFYQFTAIQCF